MNPRSSVATLLVTATLAATAFAVSPPPDGGYANETTAEGEDALFSLTNGFGNTALGYQTLYRTTNGFGNTGVGDKTLTTNSVGAANTSLGYEAIYSNTSGGDNTAVGFDSMFYNTRGDANTAVGSSSLINNLTGFLNVAIGESAMTANKNGSRNTAVGAATMYFYSASGSNNTAVGFEALYTSTSDDNIALGLRAGQNIASGGSNIAIGNDGLSTDTGAIRIGTAGRQTTAYVAGISGVPVVDGVAVEVTSSGQLGIRASSARFKEAIQPMGKASEAILALQPVTFHYKKNLDPKGSRQSGLIAEAVAKVDPDLVVRDAEGKPFTVRYDEVNAMLLNEFLKEHETVTGLKTTVAKQETTIAQQQKEIAALTAAVKEQTSQIQKVSNRLAASEAAPQMLVKNR